MGNMTQTESTSLFMAAIDGGYCTLKKDDLLTIDFASSKALKLTGEEASIHLTDFMSPADKKEFFKAYRNIGTFSVKCNLIIDNKLVPTTLKCNSTDTLIYCDITIQADWFNYAARALQDKLDYERLVNYSNTYLFAMDLKWNFINYTANFRDLLDLHEMDRNFKNVLVHSTRIHPECEKALQHIFSLNTMYKNDVVDYLKVKNSQTNAWEMYRIELRVIFSKKKNYAEFIVGSFVDVKSELANVNTTVNLRDKNTGTFTKDFLDTSKYAEILSGKTVAGYLKIESSRDVHEAFGYADGDKYYDSVFKNIVSSCNQRDALVVRMGVSECFVIQPVSDPDKFKQCLLKINSIIKQSAAEKKIKGCMTCGVVERANNMDPIGKLLDDAYLAYRNARSQGLGKVIFNVEQSA